MKSNTTLGKRIVMGAALLVLAGLVTLATAPADQPLSKDDITLLLLGSSPSGKIIQMVGERGVDFPMNPDLAKKFHDQGASDELIDALQKAGNKAAAAKASTPAPAPAPPAAANPNPPPAPEPSPGGKPNAPGAPEPRAAEPPPARATPVEPSSSEPVLHTRQSAAPVAPAPAQESNSTTTEQKIQEILEGLGSVPAPDSGTVGGGTEIPGAANLRIKDISGRTITADDFKDKVVLINFWATWCPYCRKEVPELVDLQGTYGKQGLQIVGIAVNDIPGRVKNFARENAINYPVAMGDEKLKNTYGGVRGLPTSFLIGRDGRVYQRIQGAPMDVSVFEQSIKRLLRSPAPDHGPLMAQAVPPGAPKPANPAATAPPPPAEPVLHASLEKETVPAAPAKPSAPALKDPDAQGIQHVIQEFAAKEKIFRAARNNYAYHQINKVQELGAENEVVGSYEQEWDILYDDAGKRIEKVTYAPLNTLKGLIVTKEDIEGFRNIQPFVLTSDELPDYDIKYLGHVKVDQITAYVFSIRPKEIEKNRQYFQGIVWVDDRDLQIVKSEGKQVPQDKVKHGQENLFPRFTTWREQVDGKFWFPTYTMADDTLYFSNGPPVHMKEVVRYTDYKQFKSGSRILQVESIDKPKDQTTPAAAPPKK